MASSSSDFHDKLILVETLERIFIFPAAEGPDQRHVVINRVTDEISLSGEPNEVPGEDEIRTFHIGGIIGVIHLVAGPYLIVIKSKTRVGEIQKDVIWRLGQFELIPFRKTLIHLSEKQVAYNSTYLEMLNSVLLTPYFYYSHTYDLSHNLQALELNSPDFFQQTLVERAENRFVWNAHLLESFREPEFHHFCVPLIHGFISIDTFKVNRQVFKVILISRRSCMRPGTRLLCRGIDGEGNVSNFVETEQIVERDLDMASFVQVRGSIPLFWTQNPNLKYKPKPCLMTANHSEPLIKHFDDLNLRYGRVVCIDLINQSGSEAVLGRAFKNHVEQANLVGVRYESFDFHHECRNMNWKRLEVLINRLAPEIDEYSYFLRSRGQRQYQEGVFRTNCIDCLDRTNVVQNLLAKRNLETVLQKFRILNEDERIGSHPDLEYWLKNIWADNADMISTQYSGTGALKTDFTRTGNRTFFGIMRDGYNSSVRYIKNNFSDGFRQDAMNLFLGNYTASQKEGVLTKSPLERERDWKYYSLPTLLLISVVMWASLAIFPQEYSSEYLLYILFWGSMTFATAGVIVYYGPEFVDYPVLTEAHKLSM